MIRALPLVLLAACATTAPMATTASAGAGAPQTVARFGDRVITLAQVNSHAGDELYPLEEQLFEARTQAAERIFVEGAIEEAAKKEGVSPEKWVDTHLDANVRKPSDEELHALFDNAKGRLGPDADFNTLKPQLVEFASRQLKAKRAKEMFDELKKQAGYQVVLDAPSRPRRAVEALGPMKGSKDAKVTIVVFADFECPYCSRSAKTVEAVMAAYPGKLKLVYRQFPLSFHAHAPKAAEAALCADEQGKFWEFHDALYAHQEGLDVDALKEQASRVGLDKTKFEACLTSGKMQKVVARDQAAGEAVGVKGTPAYFINGLVLSGAQPEEEFKKLIDAELAK